MRRLREGADSVARGSGGLVVRMDRQGRRQSVAPLVQFGQGARFTVLPAWTSIVVRWYG